MSASATKTFTKAALVGLATLAGASALSLRGGYDYYGDYHHDVEQPVYPARPASPEPMPIQHIPFAVDAPAPFAPEGGPVSDTQVGAKGSGSTYEDGMIVKVKSYPEGRQPNRKAQAEYGRAQAAWDRDFSDFTRRGDDDAFYTMRPAPVERNLGPKVVISFRILREGGRVPNGDESLVMLSGYTSGFSSPADAEQRVLREGMEVYYSDTIEPNQRQGYTQKAWEESNYEYNGYKYGYVTTQHPATTWRASFIEGLTGDRYNEKENNQLMMKMEKVANPGTPDAFIKMNNYLTVRADMLDKLYWSDDFAGRTNMNVDLDGQRATEKDEYGGEKLATTYFVDEKEVSEEEYNRKSDEAREAGNYDKFNGYVSYTPVYNDEGARYPIGTVLSVVKALDEYKEKVEVVFTGAVVDYARTLTKLRDAATGVEQWFGNEEGLREASVNADAEAEAAHSQSDEGDAFTEVSDTDTDLKSQVEALRKKNQAKKVLKTLIMGSAAKKMVVAKDYPYAAEYRAGMVVSQAKTHYSSRTVWNSEGMKGTDDRHWTTYKYRMLEAGELIEDIKSAGWEKVMVKSYLGGEDKPLFNGMQANYLTNDVSQRDMVAGWFRMDKRTGEKMELHKDLLEDGQVNNRFYLVDVEPHRLRWTSVPENTIPLMKTSEDVAPKVSVRPSKFVGGQYSSGYWADNTDEEPAFEGTLALPPADTTMISAVSRVMTQVVKPDGTRRWYRNQDITLL